MHTPTQAPGRTPSPSPPFIRLNPARDLPLPPAQGVISSNVPFVLGDYPRLFNKYQPQAMEILRKTGIHPDSGRQQFTNPFTGQQLVDDFSNIGDHCVAVAATAFVIASALRDKEVLSNEDVASIAKRALLHDAAKIYDVFLLKALRGGQISSADYAREDIWDKAIPVLMQRGFVEQEAREILYEYGRETGGRPECLRLFIIANERGLQGVKGSLPSKILHLADDMTCSLPPTSPQSRGAHYSLTPEERLTAAQADVKNPVGRSHGLGIDALGGLVDVALNNPPVGVRPLGSSHGLMVWISNRIADEIALLLNCTHQPESASGVEIIKALLNARLPKLH